MRENLWRAATAIAFVLLVSFAYSAAVVEFGLGVHVNPQSQAIGDSLCAGVAEYFEYDLVGTRVTTGLDMGDGVTTDTLVCDFTPNGTIPFMLIYDDGEFITYQ